MQIEQYIQKRIQTLKKQMAENHLDAIVLQRPENVFYYSNFNPVINSNPAFFILTPQGEPVLLVHAIRCDHARDEGAIRRTEVYGKWGSHLPLAEDPVDALASVLEKQNLRIGMESDYISFEFYQRVQEKVLPSRISDVSFLIKKQKIVKDEWEIANLRHSARLADLGVETAIHCLEKGYSEAEACTEGQYAMRKLWHRDYPDAEVCGFGTSEGGMVDSFHIWCLSNEHIAYGCDCPKHYHPKCGDLTLPMAWAKINGCHGESERTVAVDKLSPLREKAYHAVLEARSKVYRMLKPGITFESLYLAAEKIFIQYGFGDVLPGRIGHGIGNSAHEFPSIARGNQLILRPNMAFTVEPGLMDRQWGGVRHSEMVLVTQEGYEILSTYRNDKITIHISDR